MLSPGDRLGPYEVVAPLGAGGMGEVYRARDTRLGREVALKVLPEAFAGDPDRLKRFEREARATAALSDPNVLTVFDVGSDHGRPFVVAELLEGATLGSLLRAGPLPVRRALELAAQAARGLAAAHAKGIVHRDLKPDNLFLTDTGVVKILDFGVARLRHDDAGHTQVTTESNATASGSVLGTVSYMSPEQAKGLAVDARSDTFSLGVVLHEMLSGRHPFRRSSSAETISAILRDDPPHLGAPEGRVPGPIDGLVRRCLEKRPEDRFQSATDLALALDLVARGEDAAHARHDAGSGSASVRRKRVQRGLWGAGAVALLGAGALAYRLSVAPSTGSVSPVRFTIEVEDSGVRTGELSASGGRGYPGLVALCPDGSCVAYRAEEQGVARLHLRRFDRPESQTLPGTEDGYTPFFSPDGRRMAFFAGGRLKAVSLEGLEVRTLCEAPGGWSGSFGPRGFIFFSPRLGPVLRVSSEGGLPEGVTRLASGETSHRWASLLPDGRTLLFESLDASGRSRIRAWSTDTGEAKTLVDEGQYPRFAGGRLLFVLSQRDALFAVPFDPGRLEILGPPAEVVERPFGFAQLGGAGLFDVADNGTLAHLERSGGTPVDGMLSRVDRSGRATLLADLRRPFEYPRFSPDGRRIALTVRDEGGASLWVYDVPRRSLTRVTVEGSCSRAIWSPDGRRLTFQLERDGAANLYSQPADGSGPVERLTTSESYQVPGSWSPDGRTLSYVQSHPVTGSDIWVLPLGGTATRAFGDSEPTPLGPKWDGFFSPDGRLIAYTSIESGRLEVYVRAYPGPGKRQVSTDGGNSPVWARSGKELFYLKGGRLMVASIKGGPGLAVGQPQELFEGDYAYAGTVPNFDVAPDGQSFVMIRGERRRPWMRIHVVLNWLEELERRAPRQP